MNQQIKNSSFVFLVLFFIFLPFFFVSAATNLTYEPMEVLPGFAKTADFAVFISNLYKFGIWTIGICALIMIVIGGYMYAASAGNNASMEKAKSFITDAIAGLILALLAYLILYIINPKLVEIKMGAATTTSTSTTSTTSAPKPANCTGEIPADSTLCSSANPTVSTAISLMAGSCSNIPCTYACNNGYRSDGLKCLATTPANCAGTTPANSTLCSSPAPTSMTPISLVTACANAPCTYACNANYAISGSQCAKTTADATCSFSGKNLCQPTSCNAPSCSAYSAQISSAASKISLSGINAAKLINVIMGNESACDILANNAGSCGLMQLKPDTANTFRSQCGVNSNVDCSWLTNPANAEASICIGAKYLAALASGACGSSIRNIAAGYNGGAGACGQSNNCSGQSCDGSAVKKWECLYDDNAHTQCNTGFNEARTYAGRVLACYNI